MPVKQRRSPKAMDQLRAKALRGDRLPNLTDSEREWLWRSLLKKVRVAEVRALVKMSDTEYACALARIERWYTKRLAKYRETPKVVRSLQRSPTQKKKPWWSLFSAFFES